MSSTRTRHIRMCHTNNQHRSRHQTITPMKAVIVVTSRTVTLTQTIIQPAVTSTTIHPLPKCILAAMVPILPILMMSVVVVTTTTKDRNMVGEIRVLITVVVVVVQQQQRKRTVEQPFAVASSVLTIRTIRRLRRLLHRHHEEVVRHVEHVVAVVVAAMTTTIMAVEVVNVPNVWVNAWVHAANVV